MGAPNVLFVITDQQRADTVAALGNDIIYTPSLDRLVARGVFFDNAYSTCPVCIPARYTVRTGCEPTRTGVYGLMTWEGMHGEIEDRCGTYIATTMGKLGYRTFGIGKFHTTPWDAPLGFDIDLRSEELYKTPTQRRMDAYASWMAREHPEYDWLEGFMGERTYMYYMPQASPVPDELTSESWAAARAVEQLGVADDRPFFGVVSFLGPHPPFAPPVPFNRMYDPERMPAPVVGDLDCDHMDQQIPWMNHLAWADDIGDTRARALKARYYGKVSHIDRCLGRILDAVEERHDAENTLICFFSDHGEHLGDHHAWQKQSFFESSTKVPFLVSWPARLPTGRCRELVCLTDLFGLATTAGGHSEFRDGIDILGLLEGRSAPRPRLFGYHGAPGGRGFKVMVREGEWKLIWMANGGRAQLFHLGDDPHELVNRAALQPDVVGRLAAEGAAALRTGGIGSALDADGLRAFAWESWERSRSYQFDPSRGITGFPERPSDAL
jgi:choline-sulfatase